MLQNYFITFIFWHICFTNVCMHMTIFWDYIRKFDKCLIKLGTLSLKPIKMVFLSLLNISLNLRMLCLYKTLFIGVIR